MYQMKFINESVEVIGELTMEKFSGHSDTFVEEAELLLAATYGEDPALLTLLLKKLQRAEYYVYDDGMKQYVHQPEAIMVEDMDKLFNFLNNQEDHAHQALPPHLNVDAMLPEDSLESAAEEAQLSPTEQGEPPRPAPLKLNVIPKPPTKRRSRKKEPSLEELREQFSQLMNQAQLLKQRIEEIERLKDTRRQELLLLLKGMLADNGFTSEEATHAQSLISLLSR